MKNNKKVLVLVLSLVLVCSMLFGLVACGNNDGANNGTAVEEYATLIFKTSPEAEAKTVKVKTTGMAEGYTIDQLLSDTEGKYPVKAEKNESGMITAIKGESIDDLVPNQAYQFIAIYSSNLDDVMPDYNNPTQGSCTKIDGKFYVVANGANQIKVTANETYVFVIINWQDPPTEA